MFSISVSEDRQESGGRDGIGGGGKEVGLEKPGSQPGGRPSNSTLYTRWTAFCMAQSVGKHTVP